MSILQAVGSALRFVRGLSTRAAEKVCDSDDVLSGRSLQAFFTAVATLRDSTLEAAGLEWPPSLLLQLGSTVRRTETAASDCVG